MTIDEFIKAQAPNASRHEKDLMRRAWNGALAQSGEASAPKPRAKKKAASKVVDVRADLTSGDE